MKYFKAINTVDVDDILFVKSKYETDTLETIAARTHLWDYGYTLIPCTQEEYEEAMQSEELN